MALSTTEQLEALSRQAHRLRTSYGQLVSQLTDEEQEAIFRAYEREQRAGEPKKQKKKSGA